MEPTYIYVSPDGAIKKKGRNRRIRNIWLKIVAAYRSNLNWNTFGEPQHEQPGRIEFLHRMYPYIERQLALGLPLTHVVRHLIGLFHGEPNGRRWRRHLSENAYRKGAGIETLQEAERLLH